MLDNSWCRFWQCRSLSIRQAVRFGLFETRTGANLAIKIIYAIRIVYEQGCNRLAPPTVCISMLHWLVLARMNKYMCWQQSKYLPALQ